MKKYEGVELELHAILISSPDGDEWSASRLGCFVYAGIAQSPNWKRRWTLLSEPFWWDLSFSWLWDKIMTLWFMISCSLLDIYRRFGRNCCLHFRRRKYLKCIYSSSLFRNVQRFVMVNGPAADATDAPQPWGLLCNPVMKMISFFVFLCNGAPVEWNWQGKTKELGEKTCPSAILCTTNTTWIDPGSNRRLRGERPATNHVSHGTTATSNVTPQKTVI
jgi:hypothetical protein